MLSQLIISNFALIENVIMEPESGLNVLTGETGAGKTILIGALGILRGNRAQTEYIRKGENSASVEGYFTFENFHFSSEYLENYGLSLHGEDGVLLRREISLLGKNKCYINGKMVPLTLYAEIAKKMLDIHGQNQEQSLLKSERQMQLVDRYGKQLIETLLVHVKKYYEQKKSYKEALENLKKNSASAQKEMDFLAFQIDEIDKRKLIRGEEEELRAESKYLSHLEEIVERMQRAYDSLWDTGKALENIDEACRELEKLKEYGAVYASAYAVAQDAYYNLEEVARELNSNLSGIEFDADQLNAIEERLGEINYLRKKYGTTIDEILNFREQAQTRLEQFQNLDEELEQLSVAMEKAQKEYDLQCALLHEKRMLAGQDLGKQITNRLHDLSLANAYLSVDITPAKESEKGTDRITFIFSPNVGEGARSLARIASGGEISRIMLAIKTILAKEDEIGILVFDEVDTGVGGESLVSVAKHLSALGENKQVFCVTHSPQLAAFADCHFRISKSIKEERTITNVNKLDKQAKTDEIFRMLGGEKMEGSREQAGLILESASRLKNHQ